MSQIFYVVKYQGPFGFIKPWTAVRDGKTHSQQFLTPSIVEGMRIKLEVDSILRHRLSHQGFNRQVERIQAGGWTTNERNKTLSRKTSILTRGTLLNPCLHLVFESQSDAKKAAEQHICLCRNEDVLHPVKHIEITALQFEEIDGFELRFGKEREGAFLVGYNRFDGGRPMYGALTISGHPTNIPAFE